jgi:hypothetical protein
MNTPQEDLNRDIKDPSFAWRYCIEHIKFSIGGMFYRLSKLCTRLQRYFDGV